MTREEFESILEEAFEAGRDSAYEEVEKVIQEAEMFDESEEDEIEIEGLDEEAEEFDDIDLEGLDEEAILEALNLRKRLNNVPSPKEAALGLKKAAVRGGANFKKGVASFRKRVLGKVGKIGKAASGKFDDARKKLIKAKAKVLLKKKSL